MKVSYKQKHLRNYLLLGILFLLLGSWRMLHGFDQLLGYLWLSLALISLSQYYYSRKKAYLTIKQGYLYKNLLFSRKLLLSDIKCIRKFAGDYILMTEKAQLTIDTQIIDKDSLEELECVLAQLDLEPS
ncbi:hypothetical protein PP178_05400 [Zeaxanthinibacter sp. PT1]|uniref:hypothetical protein n=1 Tax=Zeaxanthinibacter TaxID=561554 RepID=UPI00234B579E|nr:hypothetical protein [Zeaxanthinibacter sp. PT1]MDC6350979.1 hypothetical protein [Zeaxanthinibacter sp. PT1]